MKIKTKLIISFCMVIFVPVCLALFTVTGFVNVQKKVMEENYGISNADAYSFSSDAIQSLLRLVDEDYNNLKACISTTPGNLEENSYNESFQGKLENDTYLMVRKGNEIIYSGLLNEPEVEQRVRDYIIDKNKPEDFIMDDSQQIIARVNYVKFPDNTDGVACIIIKTNGLLTNTKTVFWQISIVILVILLLTACMMILWIYQSMIAPIRKLQVAAENIKEGNLDFELEPTGSDEIAELCVTFEAMRQRLKNNAAEKVDNENENRALISNIAHDLKTPITAVKGYSEGIIDGVANTPEKIDKYIRTIYNKANEMDTLINELTLYTKYDTNRIPYNFAKLVVNQYFDDCIEEIGIDLEDKGIGLAYNNYVEDDVIIIVDPEQLRRVVNNIISNSIKYMDRQQGFINIRIKDVGDFIQVEVEDNGKGIAQKDLPYIFDRFYRADASRNSATGGSGIGLSIVKKIIEDHGGKIWATSKEGTGTTMYFVIRKFQEVKDEDE